ncbi:MAG: ATP-binding protein [Candidatus Zixiibacteriota bacterium]
MKGMSNWEGSFSLSALNEIFKISPKRPDCVNSRESSWLEFKQSFGWGNAAKYAKTCAAFANAKGGYIVFGIKNRPHKLVGLNKNQLTSFAQIDPEKISTFFSEHFAPEIHWDIHLHEIDDKSFGILHVEESRSKPVICCKNASSEIKEGDIYYRYRGKTTRIKHPELVLILDEQRKREQKLWLRHLSQISKVGVQDAGIFNLRNGKITGAKGTFIIDESLLSQLAFINEGEFAEVEGKPTLKLVGEVQSLAGNPTIVAGKQIIKTRGIRVSDIVIGFLEKK